MDVEHTGCIDSRGCCRNSRRDAFSGSAQHDDTAHDGRCWSSLCTTVNSTTNITAQPT